MKAPLCVQGDVTVNLKELRLPVGLAASILLRVPFYEVISPHGKRTIRRNNYRSSFFDFNGCWNVSDSTIGIVCQLIHLGLDFLIA